MAKFYAIPCRDNGTERMGTEGVLRGDEGEYQTMRTFLRYRVEPCGQPGVKYNIYNLWPSGHWNLLASVILP